MVTLTVDRRERQEIILAAGDEPVEYHRFLGRLPRGAHVMRVEIHPALSSPVAREVAVVELRTGCVQDVDPSAHAWRHAPPSSTTGSSMGLLTASQRTPRSCSSIARPPAPA